MSRRGSFRRGGIPPRSPGVPCARRCGLDGLAGHARLHVRPRGHPLPVQHVDALGEHAACLALDLLGVGPREYADGPARGRDVRPRADMPPDSEHFGCVLANVFIPHMTARTARTPAGPQTTLQRVETGLPALAARGERLHRLPKAGTPALGQAPLHARGACPGAVKNGMPTTAYLRSTLVEPDPGVCASPSAHDRKGSISLYRGSKVTRLVGGCRRPSAQTSRGSRRQIWQSPCHASKIPLCGFAGSARSLTVLRGR